MSMSIIMLVLQGVLDYYVSFLYLFMITCKSIETSLNAPSTCILLLLLLLLLNLTVDTRLA